MIGDAMFTNFRPRLVLIIDADPAARAMTRQAAHCLKWQAVEAVDGLSGIELLRRYGYEIGLVVLAMELPDFDGYDTCLRLRAITRHRSVALPILPTATTVEGEPFLAELGCAPVVLRPASVDEMKYALQNAASHTKPPTIPIALLSYAYRKANATEQTIRQQRVPLPRVILFAQSHLVRVGISQLLREHGVLVVVETSSVQTLTTTLRDATDHLLVCDAEGSYIASTIAHDHGVPLLVLAVTEQQRQMLLRDEPLLDTAGGVVDISTDGTLHKLFEACNAVQNGKRFFFLQATADSETESASALPPNIVAQLTGTPLTLRSIEILWLDAHGWSSVAIARRLTITEDTVQSYWKRMQRKMHRTRGELRVWFRRKLVEAQIHDTYPVC